MRKILRYLNIALMLVIVTGIIGSCVKDKFSTEEGTANIIVKLDSRADASASEDENALENEGIKNVRLILVQNGRIVYNENKPIEGGGKYALLQQGFTIPNVKVVPTDFYAIVNVDDQSLDTDYKVGSVFNNDSKNKLNIELKSKGFNLPCVYSENISLPMYGESLKQTISEGAEISIPVTRAVARIDLYIDNQTGAPLGINQIDFGEFIANKGYLISSEGKSDIEYKEVYFEVKDSKEYHFYLYEAVNVPYTNFKIGMNKGKYPLKQIDVKEESRTNLLKRNTVLRINATVNKVGTPISLDVSIEDWSDIELIPGFE